MRISPFAGVCPNRALVTLLSKYMPNQILDVNIGFLQACLNYLK